MSANLTTSGPELHVGSEQQGLSGVWVRCSCGLSTKRQTARYAEAAWTEYRAHALDALRSAVQTAWDTRQLPDTWSPNNADPVCPDAS